MQLSLKKATLIKRYKRFLADVTLADGSITTIHVANTGAMTGCADEGDTVWYSTSNNPKRKYPFSWELTEKPNGDIICVNTIRANQLIEEALIDQKIPEVFNHLTTSDQNIENEFNSYEIKREVKYGEENSKIDFLMQPKQKPSTVTQTNDDHTSHIFIEVKSVTLLEHQQGYFPDSVTTRGQKHLRELMQVSQNNQQAVLLFAILHSGINSVKAAFHIDKQYAELLLQAQKAGVNIISYKAEFTFDEIAFKKNKEEIMIDINVTKRVPIIY